MKDETKDIILNLATSIFCFLVIAYICWPTKTNILTLDKKVDTISYFTIHLFNERYKDTCIKQGGLYGENVEGVYCVNMLAFKSHLPGYENHPSGDYTLNTKTCNVDKKENNSFSVSQYSGSKEDLEKQVVPLCLKWKEAQDILRKKNYKEYACKTLDTFEDYLACNEK